VAVSLHPAVASSSCDDGVVLRGFGGAVLWDLAARATPQRHRRARLPLGGVAPATVESSSGLLVVFGPGRAYEVGFAVAWWCSCCGGRELRARSDHLGSCLSIDPRLLQQAGAVLPAAPVDRHHGGVGGWLGGGSLDPAIQFCLRP
jgi:hypothetical protein